MYPEQNPKTRLGSRGPPVQRHHRQPDTIERYGHVRVSHPQLLSISEEDFVIRIHRIGLLAGLLTMTVVAPAGAQVIYRDSDPWVREQEARFRAEFRRDQLRAQQERARMQAERTRPTRDRDAERDFQREMERHQRDMERQQRDLERQLERAASLRERELERAAELRERMLERAAELRDRDFARVIPPRDFVRMMPRPDPTVERRNYIAPPPGVRFRNRWP
jgi:hypothetical protein